MTWFPQFADAYTHISGDGARVGDMNLTLAAILTSQALNVGWKPVVTADVEALTRSRISHVYQNYVRAENHAAANVFLIGGQEGNATAELWGGGLVAAVDGTRFVVPVRSIDAFGRIFKTLHVLAYVDREPYRRGIKRMRNLQEVRQPWPMRLEHLIGYCDLLVGVPGRTRLPIGHTWAPLTSPAPRRMRAGPPAGCPGRSRWSG